MTKKNPQKMKRVTIRLSEDDLAIIEDIQKDLGLLSTLQTIKTALRLVRIEQWNSPFRSMEKK
jgi:hypothetical protein